MPEENTFAAACYDQNSIAELEAALKEPPDHADMAAWNLTPEEWRTQIETALQARKEEIPA